MTKKFIETVFEGDYGAIRGFIEGFVAGSGKEMKFFICSDSGVEAETLTEHIKEWISLGGKLHHLLIEDELFEEIRAALAKSGNKAILGSTAIKSTKKVEGANFHFRFEAYGRKYADEIKAILDRLPEGVALADYSPREKIDESCKGAELYTVCHDYEFIGEGTISGPVEAVITLRRVLDAHPLIEAGKVKLDL